MNVSSVDPDIIDNLNGTKTAKWNFNISGNYQGENVNLSDQEAKLSLSDGSWFETDDSQFNAGSNDTNTIINQQNITLLGNKSNLVKNGGFSSAGTWTYVNSADGNINAYREGTIETGRFDYEKVEVVYPFDSMDDTLFTWGGEKYGDASSITTDDSFCIEGNGSMKDVIVLNDNTAWAGAERRYTWWNWSSYNRLSFWIYDESVVGTGTLYVQIYLEDKNATQWLTPNQTVIIGTEWNQYLFDITPFPGDFYQVEALTIRFTNFIGDATLYIDDIMLYHYKTFNQTAYINQTFSKENSTAPSETHVTLTFDHSVLNYTSVLESDMSIWISGTNVWSFDITSTATMTSEYLDVSQYMTAAGQYNISIRFHLSINTPYYVGFIVDFDNILIKAPNYQNGSFISQSHNVLTGAIWKDIKWSEEEDPPDTNISVQIRRGDSEPNLLIAPWEPPIYDSALSSISGVNTSWIQYKVNINTLNASKAPTFHDITISYQNYAETGYVRTMDFTPSFTPPETFVSWDIFNSISNEPVGTFITYWYSSDAGVNWIEIFPGDNLSGAPLPPIRFRANLTTTNTSITPILIELEITYSFLGVLDHIHTSEVSWSGTAIETKDFDCWGHDVYHHNVSFIALWSTTDPWGNVDSNGLYTPGKVGTWIVSCKDPNYPSIFGNITVDISPGPLDHIQMSRIEWYGTVDDSVDLNASGYDAKNNPVTFTPQWSTNDPTGIANSTGFYQPGTTGTWFVWCNDSVNPSISNHTTVYISTGILDHIDISPPTWSGTTDDTAVFTATGYDAYNNVFLVDITWNTTDPKGTINNGVYNPGSPGTWRVYANNTNNTIWDFATVTVSLGALSYITIDPVNPHLIIPGDIYIGDTIDFYAYGYDADDNSLGATPVNWNVWSKSGNIGTVFPIYSTTTQFTATGHGTGQVNASSGLGQENCTVEFSIANMKPTILGQVPNQLKTEDYGTWQLDLTTHASDDLPISNLKWNITGYDDDLIDIEGVNIAGNHILNFTTKPDAYGNSLVTIWLEDSDGAKVSQQMWINITPINDAPFFSDQPPDISLKVGENETIDFSPYINDIDNSKGTLTIEVEGEYTSYVTVDGLKVSFYFPEDMANKNISFVLRVSDGEFEDNVTINLSILSSSGGVPRLNTSWDAIIPVGLGILGLMILLASIFIAVILIRKRNQRNVVEDLFLVHKDGRLIIHNTKQLKTNRDEDILSGMLTAVQEFVKDSMGRDQVLKEFNFQNKKVMIERGDYVYIAAFIADEEPPKAREQLTAFVGDVEEAYKYILPQWTGEVEAFRGLDDLMNRLFEGRGYTRGYWKKLKFVG